MIFVVNEPSGARFVPITFYEIFADVDYVLFSLNYLLTDGKGVMGEYKDTYYVTHTSHTKR